LDCCADRLLPLRIQVSADSTTWSQCAYVSGTGQPGQVYTIACADNGRYVRISLDQTNYLTLCEVEVWANKEIGQLISRKKPATQSSNLVWNGIAIQASNGNDGNYGQNWNQPAGTYCSHTNDELDPWWQVDLQGTFAITQVKIWNRNDCCANRLLPLEVDVSTDGKTWIQCAYVAGTGEAGVIYAISCVNSGRYVRISLDQTNYLTLCEVEVYGTECSVGSKYLP